MSANGIPYNSADEILKGVWLGNARAAMDEQFLKNNSITAVFNCTKDLEFHDSIKRRYRIPVDDNLQIAEIRQLELISFEAITKIALELKQGHHVLIHCMAGMQRSDALTAMFLIAFYRTHFMDAALHIKKLRPIAFYPSANFGAAIKEFDESFHANVMPKLGLLPGTIPEQ